MSGSIVAQESGFLCEKRTCGLITENEIRPQCKSSRKTFPSLRDRKRFFLIVSVPVPELRGNFTEIGKGPSIFADSEHVENPSTHLYLAKQINIRFLKRNEHSKLEINYDEYTISVLRQNTTKSLLSVKRNTKSFFKTDQNYFLCIQKSKSEI